MSKIIFEQKIIELNITIRYPKAQDVEVMQKYINALSEERTHITMQGEIMSLEDEKKYLDGVLEKVKNKTAVQLLMFAGQSMAGISGIELGRLTEKHIGTIGISINKKYRRLGLGKLLLTTILKEAKKELHNMEIFELAVHSKNTVAHKMYVNFGFVEYGRLPNGVKLEKGYQDKILMYKKV